MATTVPCSSSVKTKSWAPRIASATPVTARWFGSGVRLLEREAVADVGRYERNRAADAEQHEGDGEQHGARVREDAQPAPLLAPGVVEEHACDAAEEERLRTDGEERGPEELPVEREAPPRRVGWSPKLSGTVSSSAEHHQHEPRLETKKPEPYTNIARRLIQAAFQGENQPERLWWLNRPSRSLRKRHGHLGGAQLHLHRLE